MNLSRRSFILKALQAGTIFTAADSAYSYLPNAKGLAADAAEGKHWQSGEYDNGLRHVDISKTRVTTATGSQALDSALEQRTIYVNNINEMVSLNTSKLADMQLVNVMGYDIPGDGGGGFFRWCAASTELQDGGFVFAPARGSRGRWVRNADKSTVCVEWYGAKGDGEADDTDAIRAACASSVPYDHDYSGYTFQKSGGREIRLRSGGNYKITKPIYLRKGDWLRGSGYTSTRIFTSTPDIGEMIYVGHGLIEGAPVKDPGGLVPIVSDICFAETTGGTSAIYLDGIQGWVVRSCWFFVDVCVRTEGNTTDGQLLNSLADNGTSHLIMMKGAGDEYNTSQTTLIEGCTVFKSRYGGIKIDGVTDLIISNCFFNFVPEYGIYTGGRKKNSRIKVVGCNFKAERGGASIAPYQQHIRVTSPTKGFEIADCSFSYSRHADVYSTSGVSVRGGLSFAAGSVSIRVSGGTATSVSGMRFMETGDTPIYATSSISVTSCEFLNSFNDGHPKEDCKSGAVHLSQSAGGSIVHNNIRYDSKGPVVSSEGISGCITSGNLSSYFLDVVHCTSEGVNYYANERVDNPIGRWRNVTKIGGSYVSWVDSTGALRIKGGNPTNDTDGTLVGLI
ncbi:hypothetical protein [Halomonas sp. WWR20]